MKTVSDLRTSLETCQQNNTHIIRSKRKMVKKLFNNINTLLNINLFLFQVSDIQCPTKTCKLKPLGFQVDCLSRVGPRCEWPCSARGCREHVEPAYCYKYECKNITKSETWTWLLPLVLIPLLLVGVLLGYKWWQRRATRQSYLALDDLPRVELASLARPLSEEDEFRPSAPLATVPEEEKVEGAACVDQRPGEYKDGLEVGQCAFDFNDQQKPILKKKSSFKKKISALTKKN